MRRPQSPTPPSSERNEFSIWVGIIALVVACLCLALLLFGPLELVDNGLRQNLLGVTITISAGLGLSSILNAIKPPDIVADIEGNLPGGGMKFRVFGRAEIIVAFGSMAMVGILVFAIAFPNQTKTELNSLRLKLDKLNKVIGTANYQDGDSFLKILTDTRTSARSANQELTKKFGADEDINALRFLANIGEETNKDLKKMVQDRFFLKRLLAIKMDLGGNIKGCPGSLSHGKTKWIFITDEANKRIIPLKDRPEGDSSHLDQLIHKKGGNDQFLELHLVKSCDLEEFAYNPGKFTGDDGYSLMILQFEIDESTKKIQTTVKTTNHFRKQFLYDDKELADIIEANEVLKRPGFWLREFQSDHIDKNTAKQIAKTAKLVEDPVFLCEALKNLIGYSYENVPLICQLASSNAGISYDAPSQDSIGADDSAPLGDDNPKES